ncbi:MAG: hypothetical protein MZV64_43470 [Ignavibacteriales bacterium]|nr:hypothetical protein [Ignavibacteriales bacterium]
MFLGAAGDGDRARASSSRSSPGTIARTTDEQNSAFGFGIYYWMINLGAFLAPLVGQRA